MLFGCYAFAFEDGEDKLTGKEVKLGTCGFHDYLGDISFGGYLCNLIFIFGCYKWVEEDFVEVGCKAGCECSQDPELEGEETANVTTYCCHMEGKEEEWQDHEAMGLTPDVEGKADKNGESDEGYE